jgi:hypothetical protein
MRQLTLLACALLLQFATPQDSAKHSYIPQNGFVPDSATAVRIAVAVWSPIYGADQIASERPFDAVLQNGVWTVTGSLPRGHVGGVALAEIAKVDARIIRVSHGK